MKTTKYLLIIILNFGILAVPMIGWGEAKKPRPFYEYKGDYRQKINNQKKRFYDAYGYKLLELDMDWRPNEIEIMNKAFSQLSPSFYRLKGLKGFYRTEFITAKTAVSPDEIPAATFPAFSTIFRGREKAYNLYVEDDFFRIEFYNILFGMDESEAINVIQHEMAHAFDVDKGFLSITKKWRHISGFKTLNLPPLDARKGGDFLFTFLNNSKVDRFAPVSSRHKETYSRQNPQEDFANSVAAYINYPYFQYSNPVRYRFLKTKVFNGKEYFSSSSRESFETKAIRDFEIYIKSGESEKIKNLLLELGQGYYPTIAKKVSKLLLKYEDHISGDLLPLLAKSSCWLMQPEALKFRRGLVVKEKISVQSLFSEPKCKINSRDRFEKFLSKFPVINIFFYKEKERYYIQFMDPFLSLAFTRGFTTQYNWELGLVGDERKTIANGQANFSNGGNGSIRLDLMENSKRKYGIPVGRKLYLKVIANRQHLRNFRKVESDPNQIQFVFHPWFKYFPKKEPEVKVIFPLNWMSSK